MFEELIFKHAVLKSLNNLVFCNPMDFGNEFNSLFHLLLVVAESSISDDLTVILAVQCLTFLVEKEKYISEGSLTDEMKKRLFAVLMGC